MEYTIATGSDHYKLIEYVQELIQDGWVPQGGPTVAREYGSEIWGQAMVRVTKN